MDYNDPEFVEKETFLSTVMQAVVDAGYPDPGYYVDIHCGVPFIFDNSGEPRQSINADSPTAVLIDLARILEEDR